MKHSTNNDMIQLILLSQSRSMFSTDYISNDF